MVFNGEIFNYIELKEELKELGHQFITHTDTEVLLHSYIEWGKDCLHKLNGMWAFAIYDKHENTVFCARDRFGVKPFYYYVDDEYFYFASEIPSIFAVLKDKSSADYQAIFDFLVFGAAKDDSGCKTPRHAADGEQGATRRYQQQLRRRQTAAAPCFLGDSPQL